MKRLKLFSILFLLFFISQISFGQKLTLNDIENICNKKNWEGVNQFLMNKNWEFYESEKGDSEKYSTITWSFEKSYGDKAGAWFYLYTYEDSPNKISYSVFNKASYTAIQKSLSSKGYKLKNSEIEDNEIISTYTNSRFVLKITTEKRKKDSYESLTAYRFLLIKKESVYDPDNGQKTLYYYGGKIRVKYTLLNGKYNGSYNSYHESGKLKISSFYKNDMVEGKVVEYDEKGNKTYEYYKSRDKINGSFKSYYENGKLKKTGYYKKGLANGKFVEYDEEGDKIYEYYKSRDKKNGKLISYENNKISYSTYFVDDIQSGERVEYYYNEETRKLTVKYIGSLLAGKKNGLWKSILIDKEKKEKTLTITSYKEGIKHGYYQDIQGDSLIIANYEYDKLNGQYKVYVDLKRMIIGGVIETDVSKLILISEGSYYRDNKAKYWKYYDLSKALRSEGNYNYSSKTGEWKYYYTKYSIDDIPVSYSEKLYLIENYKQGKLNGISTVFSTLEKEKYKCSKLDENNVPIDSCNRLIYKKEVHTLNYKNDKLDGVYEVRDSVGVIVRKGSFRNGQRVDKWLYRNVDEDYLGRPFYYFSEGSYENDKKEGKWVYYLEEGNKIYRTINYSKGKFDGKFTNRNSDNNITDIKIFSNGNFKELIVYGSLGKNPKRKYEIFDKYSFGYKCLFIEFSTNGKTSQVYWLKEEDEINYNGFDFSFQTKLEVGDEEKIYKKGKFQTFNLEGNSLIEGKYDRESKIGKWTYFYYSQNVILEIEHDVVDVVEKYLTMTDELYSGDFTHISIDENLKEVRSIKKGLRNGKTIFIDLTTGKTIKKVKYKNGQLK